MKKEFYRTLSNPATKNVALHTIKNELGSLTDFSNIINVNTDVKVKHGTQYIRTTVFVQKKQLVNIKNLDRVQSRLQKLFGIKFKVIFCNANLSVKEELRLSGIKGTNIISFLDLENFVTPTMSNQQKIENVKNLLRKSLVFLSNQSLVICANGELLKIVKQEFESFVDSSNIVLIQTGGKDCSDLRLVQSIQKLFQLNKLKNYNQINLGSGDGFFNGIIEFLENKGFTVRIYGQKKITHHQISSRANYIPLNSQNLVTSSL